MTDTNDIILSIVIVEYNSIPEIQTCLESLTKHIHVSHEFIISSNSCYDTQKQEEAKATCTDAKWIFNKANEGFASGMNRGMEAAKGSYIVIMNPDCQFQDDLDPMVEFMQKHQEVGAIAPQIIDAAGNLQDTARQYVSLPRYCRRQMERITKHKVSILDKTIDYTKIQTVDWFIGAFMMVSRKAYELTHGLDEAYFMYAEDLDWCTRIRQQGLEVVYFPKVRLVFKGTRRARKSTKYAVIFFKSHIHFWKKFGFFGGYPKRKELTF